jgi:hypothetical protein
VSLLEKKIRKENIGNSLRIIIKKISTLQASASLSKKRVIHPIPILMLQSLTQTGLIPVIYLNHLTMPSP